MPVKVRCPKCQKILAAPDAAIGKAIRCPDCQEKIRVPAPQAKKPKDKPESKPQSVEDHLLKIDLSNIEDEEVKFCVNCHAELPYIDEDDENAPQGPVICAKCGVDQATGKLSKKFERIKQLKGIDPDLFHKHLRSGSIKFLQDNPMIALRTSVYMLVTSNLCFFFFFMVLWCTNTPPKVFWGAWAFVAAMVTPGWTWYLTTVIVQSTLEKLDVLKKVNFDFFLCGALGINFLAWQFDFLWPFWSAAYGMFKYGDMELAMCAIVVVVGLVMVIPMLPVVMAHMSMPVTVPGWLPHKVIPIFFKNAKACLHWAFWLVLTSIPLLALWGVIGLLYFDDVEEFFSNVNRNSEIAWGKMVVEEMSSSKAERSDEEKERLSLAESLAAQEPVTLDETVTLVPLSIWMVSSLYYGFFVVFNMRGIGLLTTVFKRELDLQSMKKETKFVSIAEKKRRKEEARRKKQEEKLKANEVVFDEDELEDEDEEEE